MNRASPSGRATAASQSNPQAVSSIAGIPDAIARALEPLKSWSLSRFCGSSAEKVIWLQYHSDAPQAIIRALHDAGFAIAPMGGRFPTQFWRSDDERGMHSEIRVQMELTPAILGAEQRVPTHLLDGVDFRRDYLPRSLARVLLHFAEDRVGEELAQAIEARRAETRQRLGPQDESAVRQDAPKDAQATQSTKSADKGCDHAA
jgi:hypothetical protein